ncbi:hypothetical protein FQR65_LT20859 [Abscondita terminalis]|nr:hypothetical protein FQR65_LT20859 [Abscondita terminalis]
MRGFPSTVSARRLWLTATAPSSRFWRPGSLYAETWVITGPGPRGLRPRRTADLAGRSAAHRGELASACPPLRMRAEACVRERLNQGGAASSPPHRYRLSGRHGRMEPGLISHSAVVWINAIWLWRADVAGRVPHRAAPEDAAVTLSPPKLLRRLRIAVALAAAAQAAATAPPTKTNENNLAKVQEPAMSSRHPGGEVFNQFARRRVFSAKAQGTLSCRTLLSTLDTLAWRYNGPRDGLSRGADPGQARGGCAHHDETSWGNVYPARAASCIRRRHKSGAVRGPARRRCRHAPAGSCTVPARWLANARTATGRPAALVEAMPPRGNGRSLTPSAVDTCVVFPHSGTLTQARKATTPGRLLAPFMPAANAAQVFPRQRRISSDGATIEAS